MNQYPPNQPDPNNPRWSQPNPYNTPTTPGQYYPIAPPPPPASRRRRMWNWYRTRRKRTKLGIGCGIILAALFLCTCSAAIAAPNASQSTASTGTTPTATTQAFVTRSTPASAKIAPTPSPTPTATPTPSPTPKPTPTRPPAKPTPTPKRCNAVNGNPWCYNFNAGNLIYSPPGAFCSYFACIGNFWNGRGFVNECQDGEYSKSGGIRGDCSHHGGEMRPLYSHS